MSSTLADKGTMVVVGAAPSRSKSPPPSSSSQEKHPGLAVSNLIREAKTFQIPSMIQVGRNIGMVALNDAPLGYPAMPSVLPIPKP